MPQLHFTLPGNTLRCQVKPSYSVTQRLSALRGTSSNRFRLQRSVLKTLSSHSFLQWSVQRAAQSSHYLEQQRSSKKGTVSTRLLAGQQHFEKPCLLQQSVTLQCSAGKPGQATASRRNAVQRDTQQGNRFKR